MPIAAKPGAKPGVRPAPAAAKSAAAPANKAAPVQASAQIAKEARIIVTKTVLQNGTMKGEPITLGEEVEVKLFATNPANVGATARYTRQIGNFESVQIGVDAHVPCYVEEMDDVFAQISDKLKGKLEEFITDLQIQPQVADGSDETVGEEGAAEGTEEQPEEAGAEDGGLTLEDIKGYDETQLQQLADMNPDFGVSHADYAEVEDLRQVLIQAALGEEVLQEYLGTLDGAGEQTEGGEEQPAQGYTEEELNKATPKELQDIFKQWELGDYPKGPPPIAAKAARKKILEAQGGPA